MVGHGSATPSTLTGYQSNVTMNKRDVKKQSITEAEESIPKDNIVPPKITMNADAQDKADRKN